MNLYRKIRAYTAYTIYELLNYNLLAWFLARLNAQIQQKSSYTTHIFYSIKHTNTHTQCMKWKSIFTHRISFSSYWHIVGRCVAAAGAAVALIQTTPYILPQKVLVRIKSCPCSHFILLYYGYAMLFYFHKFDYIFPLSMFSVHSLCQSICAIDQFYFYFWMKWRKVIHQWPTATANNKKKTTN